MLKRRYDLIWDIGAMPAQQQMERLLEYLASGRPPLVQFYPGAWQPAVDVYETEAEVVVVAELAGVGADDMQVLAGHNSLVISGERRNAPGGRRSYHQMEIPTGPFQRVIPLPASVDPERAEATCRDGLLAVALPKRSGIIARQVAISITSRTG